MITYSDGSQALQYLGKNFPKVKAFCLGNIIAEHGQIMVKGNEATYPLYLTDWVIKDKDGNLSVETNRLFRGGVAVKPLLNQLKEAK